MPHLVAGFPLVSRGRVVLKAVEGVTALRGRLRLLPSGSQVKVCSTTTLLGSDFAGTALNFESDWKSNLRFGRFARFGSGFASRFVSRYVGRHFSVEVKVKSSLDAEKVELRGLRENEKYLTWYTCGPTVYDAAHLGHARFPFLSFSPSF